jgi:hypothetical protein
VFNGYDGNHRALVLLNWLNGMRVKEAYFELGALKRMA